MARRHLAGTAVSFQVVPFEGFEAEEGSFELIVSATAWHWVDPEVRLDKTARLLCPGGWLALLSTGERYDDPFRAKLLEMWVERATDGGAWVSNRSCLVPRSLPALACSMSHSRGPVSRASCYQSRS